jgi:hypothetical protein
MVISSPAATSLTQLVNSPQPQAPQSAPASRTETASQDSSVVRISSQAQELNRSENQSNAATRAETRTNVNTERAETRPQEKAEPPGIQFVEGEDRNGRINTFA